MKLRNPRFGYQRIAVQIGHAFGAQIDRDIVRRVLSAHCRPDHPDRSGPSWLTFFAQAKDSLWSVDLFRCESILLRSRWVLVAIDVFTRRIIGFGIGGEYIDGQAVCRMFNQAIAGHTPPALVNTDHDPLFRFHRWLANLRVIDVQEIKSVPYAPMSHPFIERLIGTIRREYLDHTFFWNSIDSRLVAALEPVLPDPARFLRVHGLAFGALKRLAELFEVLDGAIHAHSSH
jgi:putative transposase